MYLLVAMLVGWYSHGVAPEAVIISVFLSDVLNEAAPSDYDLGTLLMLYVYNY